MRTRRSLLAALLLAPAALFPLPACLGPCSDLLAEPWVERPWRELFDGRTLDGWVTQGGRYDGTAVWTVEDGLLTGRVDAEGRGGLIYTAEPYTSFELECSVRMDDPFDSGIFLRMAPEGRGAQVTLDQREGGEIAAIYSDGFLAHNAAAADKWIRGGWNQVRVRCTGFDMRIVVELNAHPVMDYHVPAGTPGFAPRGLIGLQVHGDRDDPRTNAVQFREVRVRELLVLEDEGFHPRADGSVELSPAAVEHGWRSLATTLDDWEPRGASDGYALEGGVLAIPSTGSGELRTREDFGDFRLRVDFRIERMANSGLYLRGARDAANPSYDGCEIQILDDFDWERETGTKLLPYQLTGGLYGVLPAGWKRYRPPGQWNTVEVLFAGSRLAVALNGLTLYDVDVTTLPTGEHPPFAQRPRAGFLGFQRYGAPGVKGPVAARFRNVLVQQL